MHSYRKYRNKQRLRKCKDRFRRLKDRFERISSSQGLYRSRNGIFMGVCRGVAEHYDFSVFWMRFLVLLLFLFTGFWPVGVMYIIAGLVLKVEPVSPLHNERDEEFYNTYTHSRKSAIARIKRKYENIERRIQRMEDTVTSREFNWK